MKFSNHACLIFTYSFDARITDDIYVPRVSSAGVPRMEAHSAAVKLSVKFPKKSSTPRSPCGRSSVSTTSTPTSAAWQSSQKRNQPCAGARKREERDERRIIRECSPGCEFPCGCLRVRLHIIRNERIENVGKSQSCMVSKLRIICKQTVQRTGSAASATMPP